MTAFIFNPPSMRRGVHRKRSAKSARKVRKAHTWKSSSDWRSLVKRHGVAGAVKARAAVAKSRARRRRSAKKAYRTSRPKQTRKVATVARKKKRFSKKARAAALRNLAKARRARKGGKKAHRKSRKRYSKKASRKSRRKSHRKASRKASRKSYSKKHRAKARRKYGRKRGHRKSRRSIRRHGKGSKRMSLSIGKRRVSASWNPALTVGSVSRSIAAPFSLPMLKDGLAIAGGIIGTLALPAVIQNVLPASIRSRVSLTTGWTGHAANFASAGLVGYVAGLALGREVGRKVLFGGIGAAVAKLLLDKVPLLRAKTGVTLSGDSDLDRMVEQEIAAELASGGGMGGYLTPGGALAAGSLGDYVTVEDPSVAVGLGAAAEFGEDDFDAEF